MLTLTLSTKQNHKELGAGYINTKDNFTYIHNKSIINLTDSPTGLDLYVPVFSLYYNGFLIGVGENIEGVGYRHDFGDFAVEAGINSYEVLKKNGHFGKIRDEKEFLAIVSLNVDNIFLSSNCGFLYWC